MSSPSGYGFVIFVNFALASFLPALVFAGAMPLSQPTIDECDALVVEEPNVADSYYCFFISVNAHGRASEAIEHLEAIVSLHPRRHRAQLILAMIEAREGHPRAQDDFHSAIEGALDMTDIEGVVHGRLGLAHILDRAGFPQQAEAERAEAVDAARASHRRDLLAWAWQAQAFRAAEVADYGGALRLYRQAEAVAFPEGPAQLQGFVLSGLGSSCWYLGLHEEAMKYWRREAEHWRRLDAQWQRALVLNNLALLGSELELLGRISAAQVEELEDQALAAAVQAGNRRAEAAARLAIGQRYDGEKALVQFEAARFTAEKIGDLDTRLLAMRLMAQQSYQRGAKHHAVAYRLLDEAIDLARRNGSPFHLARGLASRASLVELDGTHEEIVAAWLKAIEAAEHLRELQPVLETRARVFSRWTYPFDRLSGYLFNHARAAVNLQLDLNLAFEIIERKRARALLDALEAEKARVRDQIARTDSTFDLLRARAIPTFGMLRQALADDQALLAFQLSNERDEGASRKGGGAWVLAITRNDAHVFELPSRSVLRERIEIYTGLLARRDGSQARVAALLGRELLNQALDALPATITRLVLVPDLELFNLPFGSLTRRVNDAPLASKYEISYAPSAALWLRWKQSSRIAASSRVLALVDPELTTEGAVSSRDGFVPWELPPVGLPHARHEGRAVLEELGGGRLLEGIEASEAAFKAADPASYGVLYLATHVLTDEFHFRRSAVLLAPGSPQEDGLLQVREIVDLDLAGKVVFLSGCRSARGEVLRGEGVLGLSRALFQAGARAVVGSLSVQRDDEMAELMELCVRELSHGKSLSASLSDARRARIAAGAPVASWSGLVLIGDGDFVLFSPSSRPESIFPLFWLLLASVVVSLSTYLGLSLINRIHVA